MIVEYTSKALDMFHPDENTLVMLKDMASRYPFVKVTVEPLYDERTKKQNSYFYVLLKRFAWQSGMTVEEAKEYITHEAISRNYPYQTINGEMVTDERGEAVPIPTHEACISDFKILIDTVNELALQMGYNLDSKYKQ